MTSDPHVSPDRPGGASPLPGEPPPPPMLDNLDNKDLAPAPGPPPEDAVKFTKAAALWSSLILGFLILIVLLVFIMQNTDSTTVNFFAWQASLPVGVAVLLSAVGGGLLTFLVGTARIVQLRRAAKKNLKARL